MSRLASLAAAAMLLSGAAAPLAAQSQGDPVRLDDFAVSSGQDKSLGVEQLSPDEAHAQAAAQPHDRSVATQERAEQPTPSVQQLSSGGQTPGPPQLSKVGAAPDESAAAVSSTAESRPQGVQHIGGTDRCDPQLAAEERARCQHILELRAQEFHAPAPPQLSAEEALLAEQRANEAHDASRSPETRLRLASKDNPDAELESNQELASLYLKNQPQEPQKAPDSDKPAAQAALEQALQSFENGTSPPPTNP